jgi:hypothetical protein
MRCSFLLPLCLLALPILAVSSAVEMGYEDQIGGPCGASLAEIGEAPIEPEREPDAQSISRMMELTGISALHDRNITGKGVTIALLDSQFYYDNETAEKLAIEHAQ